MYSLAEASWQAVVQQPLISCLIIKSRLISRLSAVCSQPATLTGSGRQCHILAGWPDWIWLIGSGCQLTQLCSWYPNF